MYLAYLDDAGSTGGNLADKNAPFQIVGAVIFPDSVFEAIELLLASTIDDLVPEILRPSFEFHAADLWARNPPFDCLSKEAAEKLMYECVQTVRSLDLPIIYAAVNKKRLSEQIYSTANPIDIAFRLCVEGIEQWMCEHDANNMAILIADEGEAKAKNAIKNAFRLYRRKVRS